MNTKSNIDESDKLNFLKTLKSALELLSYKDRKKYLFAILIQIILNALELAGIGLVLGVASIAIHGIQSTEPGSFVKTLLNLLGIQGFAPKFQVYILGALVIFMFISRTLLSIFLVSKNLKFLSNRAAELSSTLIDKTFKMEYSNLKGQSTQELLFAVTNGVTTICLGILGTGITFFADLSLTFILLGGIIFVSPIIGLTSVFLFGTVLVFFHFKFKSKVYELSSKSSEVNIASNYLILDVIYSFRELFVRNQLNWYQNKITKLRYDSSDILAQQAILPNITKYIMDISVVIGAFLVLAIQFTFLDPNRAFATVTIFVTASARIAPALLRMQQSLFIVRSHLGTAKLSFLLIEKLKRETINSTSEHRIGEDFIPEIYSGISLENVSFSYSSDLTPALNDVSLNLTTGSKIAIVGQSGSGKTTLLDLIMGVHSPSSGQVRVFGLEPRNLIKKWPHVFGYVPQEVYIKTGTLRQNIEFGFPDDSFMDSEIIEALRVSQLIEFLDSKLDGLDFKILERGANLSGGQRQRIGIARAMLGKPKIILLDEATSALDAKSEDAFANIIKNIGNEITVITIAHRLSTLRDYDRIVYVENGQILYVGTFDEVRNAIPNFDIQAKLLGL